MRGMIIAIAREPIRIRDTEIEDRKNSNFANFSEWPDALNLERRGSIDVNGTDEIAISCTNKFIVKL